MTDFQFKELHDALNGILGFLALIWITLVAIRVKL